jgi:hypothetical protein
MCCVRHSIRVAKHEDVEYVPPSSKIDEAVCAQRGLSQYLRHGRPARSICSGISEPEQDIAVTKLWGTPAEEIATTQLVNVVDERAAV